jgi:hypothetical protein
MSSIRLYIDSRVGTHVLGSRFGSLDLTYRDRHGDSYVHTAKAKLWYDPSRKGQVSDPWWMIATTDDEIAAYYRWIVQRRFDLALDKPSWGAHVTVVRGEQPVVNDQLWASDNGLEIDFSYTHEVYTNGVHWWLNVDCDAFEQIRVRYGFPSGKRHFHLSIGRIPNKAKIGHAPNLPPDA